MGKDGDIIDPNLDIHEIKREQNYLKTGNFFIETSFKGEPSGINGTKARFWVHCYLAPDNYWYFYKKKVKLLKLWLQIHQHDIKFLTDCGDDNNSTGYLIKKEIFPIMNWSIYKVINKTKNKK